MESASVTSETPASPDAERRDAGPRRGDRSLSRPERLEGSQYPAVLRYGAAVLLALLAALLQGLLGRFTVAPSYLTFYPGVMLAAVFLGRVPGMATTLLSSACSAYFFLDPPGFGVGKMADLTGLAVFTGMGVSISFLAESSTRARRQSADKLRSVALYSRSLIEAGIDPLMAISPEGKITDVNKSTEEVTGVARSVLIGTDFASYFTEPEDARTGYREVFDQGHITDYPLAIRHISGKITYVLCHASVYRDESGRVVGVCGTAHDITGRNRSEHELALHRQHLEDLVEQRTAEIQSSNTRLESAYKELETFAYSVSHDLRTPLRAVDGFSRILAEEYGAHLDAEGRRIVGVIREGTRKMAQLIDDILAFSRASRQEIVATVIDMGKLVRAALADLEPALAGYTAKVEIQALPDSLGDAPMIQVLWTNLLDNAIKFTGSNSDGVIEIGAVAGEKEIVYYIRDNGVGFDMQYAGKLFGVFQRLHGQHEFPGTGIGLAIVQRIVARHGGRVWAEGQVGQGATFYFALPNGGA
jgi:PAS domain S-box-containing protein